MPSLATGWYTKLAKGGRATERQHVTHGVTAEWFEIGLVNWFKGIGLPGASGHSTARQGAWRAVRGGWQRQCVMNSGDEGVARRSSGVTKTSHIALYHYRSVSE